MQASRDLWRTRLCRHGPTHGISTPSCQFAHSLLQLRPPDERYRLYPKVWDGGVDRWYGQAMTDEQLGLISDYYKQSPYFEIPLWARGLTCYDRYGDADDDGDLPWAYGLTMDCDFLVLYRADEQLPFEFAPGLWSLLKHRRSRLWRELREEEAMEEAKEKAEGEAKAEAMADAKES